MTESAQQMLIGHFRNFVLLAIVCDWKIKDKRSQRSKCKCNWIHGIYSFLQEIFEFAAACLQKNSKLYNDMWPSPGKRTLTLIVLLLSAFTTNIFFEIGNNPMMNPFAMPDLYFRLATNPKTKAFLEQEDYRKTVETLRQNPQLLGT